MISGNQIFHNISQVLSPATFRKILSNENTNPLKKKIAKYSKALDISKTNTNHDVIEKIYDCLKSNYRNEYFYKNVLITRLIQEKKLKSTVILNELRIGKSIADSVFINGESVVYEIKTELDNPDKLLSQIADYQKAFKKITVVTHYSTYYKYYQLLKRTNIGVIYLNENNELVECKKAISVSDSLDYETLFKILRKEEYSSIIKRKFETLPLVPNTQYFKACYKLVTQIPILEFYDLVMVELKKRNTNEAVFQQTSIPEELNYICYTLNLKSSDYVNLHSFLRSSIKI